MSLFVRALTFTACVVGFPMIEGCIGCGGELPHSGQNSINQDISSQATPATSESGRTRTGETVIRMRREGGVYKIPLSINGTEMEFIFDTGASIISISNVEASFLVKQGKIGREDVQGAAQFVDALGNVSKGTIVNLREVSIGDRVVHNVKASVVDNSTAPLLLGQTFLEQFGSIKIDYRAGTLTFE